MEITYLLKGELTKLVTYLMIFKKKKTKLNFVF